MIRLSTYVVLAAVAVFSFTGCNRRDDRYDPTTPLPTGYQYVFDEPFNNDTRGWAFDTDSAYAFVENGEYKFVDNSYLGELNTAVVSTGANVDGNFLVQTRMESNYEMGLLFGANGNSHYGYSFFIDNYLQQFSIYNEGGSSQQFERVADHITSNFIKQEGYNDVEVEQRNGRWFFYINGNEVYSMQARYLGGDQFGFMVLDRTTGYADYLTVKW